MSGEPGIESESQEAEGIVNEHLLRPLIKRKGGAATKEMQLANIAPDDARMYALAP